MQKTNHKQQTLRLLEQKINNLLKNIINGLRIEPKVGNLKNQMQTENYGGNLTNNPNIKVLPRYNEKDWLQILDDTARWTI